MKVIKAPSKNDPVQITCIGCTAVLEVLPEDITQTHYDQRDGNSYEFVCPCCKKRIFIDMEKIKWNLAIK